MRPLARRSTLLTSTVDPSTVYRPTLRLPARPAPTVIVSHFQSGHGWTRGGSGASAGGSNLNDTAAASFIMGTQAATIGTTGTSGSGQYANLDSPSLNANMTGGMLRVLVKVDDVTHLQLVNLYAGDATLANSWKWQVQAGYNPNSNYVSSGEWVWLCLNVGDAVATGTPNPAAVAFIRLQVQDDNTGNPVTAHWQAVEVVPSGAAAFPNGVVSITFDDSWQSAMDLGKPRMDQYGYRGTIFPITSVVGSSGRLTIPELRALQDQLGWEIAAHAYTDADHSLSDTGMTAAQLDADSRNQKAWLVANGFRGEGHAYPLGQFGPTADGQPGIDTLRKYWAYCRTTLGKSNPNGVSLREVFPPPDPFRLRAQSGITTFSGGYAPSNLTAATTGDLDKAKAQGQWLILVFHAIVTGAPTSTTTIGQSDFNAIVDGINSRGMTVLPIGDVLRYNG